MRKPPDPDPDDETPLDMQRLTKLGLWGGAAAAGLLLVAIAAYTDAGQRRLTTSFQGGAAQAQITALEEERRHALREAEIENRRLAGQIRNLSEDRDRLLARMTVLERNYEDVTGSISKLSKPPLQELKELKATAPVAAPAPAPAAPAAAAAPPPAPPEAAPVASIPAAPERATPVPAAPPAPPPQAAVPQPAVQAPAPAAPAAAARPQAASPAPPPAAVPAPPPPVPAPAPQAAAPAPEPVEGVPARTEFGVDLGGAANVAALRNSWERIRRTHSSTLEGLRPVIGIRDGRGGQVELRLVVGPISNAANAAKLCATLAMAGLSCQPTTFDGQRLALR